MATIIPHTTRATGTVLTATIYNADHQNHITNATSLNTGLAGRTIVGTTGRIAVSNGDGIAGNPTIDTINTYSTKSGTYTLVAADRGTDFRFTATATANLTAAATMGSGFRTTIFADGGAVTIDPAGAELVNGAATLVIPQESLAFLYCDGSAWFATLVSSVAGNNTWAGTQTFSAATTFNANMTSTAGIDFGSEVAASITDLSRHIALWSTTFGFNVTSGKLNYVVASGAVHSFVVNGVEVAQVNSAGIQLAANNELSFSGTGAAETKDNLGIVSYTSSAQNIVLGGLVSLTHNLGGTPTIVQIWARCTSANNGFSINEEALLTGTPDHSGGVNDMGMVITKTTTQIHIRTGTSRFQAIMMNPDNGNAFQPDEADFDYFVTAIRIT